MRSWRSFRIYLNDGENLEEFYFGGATLIAAAVGAIPASGAGDLMAAEQGRCDHALSRDAIRSDIEPRPRRDPHQDDPVKRSTRCRTNAVASWSVAEFIDWIVVLF
jgi:hypothetical protein